jgi:predicted PurR-regulated permease PerM
MALGRSGALVQPACQRTERHEYTGARIMRERLVSQRIFFFTLVGILIILTLIMVWPFMTALLAAVAVVVILKPLYNWFLDRKWMKGSENRAVGATIIIFVLVIAIPIVLIVGSAVNQAARLFGALDSEDLGRSFESTLAEFEDTLQQVAGAGFEIDRERIAELAQEVVHAIAAWFGDLVISLGASLPWFFTTVIIVLVVMAVMLPRYKRPGKQDVVDIIPFPEEITHLYLDKIDAMITAMFKGTFVLAIVQGLAMGVVFWIAGVPYVTLLTLFSMVVSVIPIAGISWVAWPVAIILILTGDVVAGVFVIATFLLVVANIDTVLRPKLVPKEAYLNPALVILSVFGGIKFMGFIGIIYGPVIMILLVTSVEVYTKYMLRSDLEALAEQGGLDLEELGLAPREEDEEADESGTVVNVVKGFAARFRRGTEAPAPEA